MTIEYNWIKIYYLPFLIGAIIPLVYEEIMSTSQMTTNPSIISTIIVPKQSNQTNNNVLGTVQYENNNQSHVYDFNFKYNCAEWIKKDSGQRKVLFIKNHNKDNTSRKINIKIRHHQKHQEGDFASQSTLMSIEKKLKKGLILNDFQIDEYVHINQKQFQRFDLSLYHRIFYIIDSKSDVDEANSLYNNFFSLTFDILCKLRVVIDDVVTWDKDDDDIYKKLIFSRLDKKQIILGYPDSRGTFLGSCLFDDDYMKTRQTLRRENKKGLFRLDRIPTSFDMDVKKALNELVANNFTIHVICGDYDTISCNSFVKEGFIFHNKITLEEYTNIVSECTFTFGESMISAGLTSWLDLALGAAILNPIDLNQRSNERFFHMGTPYIYNVKMGDIDQIIEAAESSYKNQFFSRVPPDLRSGTMSDRVCAMLEDDSLCVCTNPTFETNKAMKKELIEKYGSDSQFIDCRANFLTRKGPVFSPLHSVL